MPLTLLGDDNEDGKEVQWRMLRILSLQNTRSVVKPARFCDGLRRRRPCPAAARPHFEY